MNRSLLAFLAFLAAACLLAGCKSDAEKLIELRLELRTSLDALYARYGGGALANQARADAEAAETAGEGRSTAARLFGEVDRSYFEAHCLARGRGERPFNLSGKLETFMKEAEAEDTCRHAAKLDVRIRDLETKVAQAQ